MAEAHIREFRRFEGDDGPVLFDRGLPDVVGFLDVSGLAVPRAIERACQTFRYGGVILRAPAWAAIYRQDAERIQDWDQAIASDAAVTAAWQCYGYTVTDLPFASIERRLAMIQAML